MAGWQMGPIFPGAAASTMVLFTDGTVGCADEGAALGGGPNWWRLVPDSSGGYLNGTWVPMAGLPESPLYYASAILPDGTFIRAGGEYNAGVNVDLGNAEIYDPVANTWTALNMAQFQQVGWTNIGDAPCVVLPDGRFMIGDINSGRCAIFNPATRLWQAAANKINGSNSEETWTLLPNGNVLTAECTGHPGAEIYDPATNVWTSVGPTPQWQGAGGAVEDLVEAASIEIGPALALMDGRAFLIGATGHTALYTPGASGQPGTWAKGPDFPPVPAGLPNAGLQQGAKDAPCVMLVNGHVLCAVGPVDGVSGDYFGPTAFYDFDPTALTLARVLPDPANSGNPPFCGRLLALPDGTAAYTNGTNQIAFFSPGGGPQPAWRPVVQQVPVSLNAGGTYSLTGTQINGLTQGAAYGDDADQASNYPIVRIRNLATSRVAYCRSFGFSTMGIATGAAPESTQFQVPAAIDGGAAALAVVANGIASLEMAVTVNAPGAVLGSSVLFDNTNVAAVQNQPANPTVYSPAQAVRIDRIHLYYWNNGQGALPGMTVTLRNTGTGALFGPYATVLTPGQGGALNVNVDAFPNVVLPPGNYELDPSDKSRWSQNAQSSGCGFARLEGAPTVIPPVTLLFDNSNTGAVANHPTMPVIFHVSHPTLINEIWTYFWNGGAGDPGGSISLQSAFCVFGPYHSVVSGVPGHANVNHAVFPNVVIPAGDYVVLSVGANGTNQAWSQNQSSNGQGFTKIWGG